MEWNLLNKSLLHQFKNEEELIKSLKEVQANFTTERGRINEYLRDERLLSAYTLVYMPTNMAKWSFVLNQLPEAVIAKLNDCAFIDFGCGPGTYTLAFLGQISEKDFNGSFYAIDSSRLMLKQARKCIDAFYPHRQIEFCTALPTDVAEKYKVLLLGNCINEMLMEEALTVIDGVDPDLLVFIEPGTKSCFKKILGMRKACVDRGYHSIYPCRHLNGNCPLEGQKDEWCHQYVISRHPPELERICQKARMDRRTLPLIAHVYSKEEDQPVNQDVVILRKPTETKFSFEFPACRSTKVGHERIHLQLLKREIPKNQQKSMKDWLEGTQVQVVVDKELGQDRFRARLNNS